MTVKLPFWASVFTVLGVMILCALGVWQIYRLHWKTEILARIDTAFAQIKDGDISHFSLSEDMVRDDFIIGGLLEGRYLHDREVLIQSRVHDGVPGYHIITPFMVSGEYRSFVVLVNRGWIPVEAERGDNFEVFRPEGVVKISGMLIHPPDAQYQPENDADRDMWYRVDIAQFQDFMKIDNPEPKILYTGYESGRSGFEQYPVHVMEKLRSNMRNNHAQYASFWFAMAVVLIGVYIFRFAVPQKK